jgi:hypothetical protein
LIAALAIGGLFLTLTLIPGFGTFKKQNLFLNQPASYWSQRLREPPERKEVWEGRFKVIKDVDAVADLHHPAAVPVLIDLLQDQDSAIRQKAILILARIGPAAKPAIPELQQALNDPDADVRANAAIALRQLELIPGGRPGGR